MIDTHAGAGLYDLRDPAARRSGEAAAGVARLLAEPDPPDAFAALIKAVRACNAPGRLEHYPGSPWLAARALEHGQTYVGCELRTDDHAALTALFRQTSGGPERRLLQADGYVEAAQRLERSQGPTLLVIDPPYERADDYARVAGFIAARREPTRQAALIWLPLKDLETFDAFVGRMEAMRPARLLVAQVRLRPLHDPMRMNGCAVVLVDGPDLVAPAQSAAQWIAGRLGEADASARVERLA